MTVGILAFDGLDYRLATDVSLFSATPLTAFELTNDLEGDFSLFTPRVWTSIMAGTDQKQVTGWNDADTWASLTSELTFIWDRFPATRIQGLKVHRDGLTRSDVMPAEFTEATNTFEGLKQTAGSRASYWNAMIDRDPQVAIAWFGFPDRAGHLAGKRDSELRRRYVWMRDELLPMLDWPDDVVLLSDHGFRIPECDDADVRSWAGRHAHARTGTLATTGSLRALRDYGDLSTFIPCWQGDVAACLRNRNLAALGYRDD